MNSPRRIFSLRTACTTAVAAAVFALMLGAVNDMTAADGRGTLLTAHALYSSGSLKLDDYLSGLGIEREKLPVEEVMRLF